MDDLRFYVLFNRVSVISGRWDVDNERLCTMELRLRSSGDRTRSPFEIVDPYCKTDLDFWDLIALEENLGLITKEIS